jgi:hypothetical protein
MVSRQMGAWYHNFQVSGGFAATSLPCFRPRKFFVDLVKLDLDLVGDFAKEQHGLFGIFDSCFAGIADDDLSQILCLTQQVDGVDDPAVLALWGRRAATTTRPLTGRATTTTACRSRCGAPWWG